MEKVTVSHGEKKPPGSLKLKVQNSSGSCTYTAVAIFDEDDRPHHTEDNYVCENNADRMVQFAVGVERQLMTGEISQMASVSPVFRAMFRGAWRDGKELIEIPDVRTDAFDILLRYAKGQQNPGLTDSNVWHVLKVADKYHVSSLIRQCFHFLLHQHSNHQRSVYLCLVTETARQLNHKREYDECLNTLKSQAGKVFKSPSALALLSHESLLGLVQADDLQVANEIAVHEAVMTWARSRSRCRQHSATASRGVTSQLTWEEMRAAAGDIVHHVRYLTMPRTSLTHLLNHRTSSCLLTEDEAENLLRQDGSLFPETVRKPRKRFAPWLNTTSATRSKYCGWGLLIVFVMLLTFIVQYICLRFLVVRMVPFPMINGNETLFI